MTMDELFRLQDLIGVTEDEQFSLSAPTGSDIITARKSHTQATNYLLNAVSALPGVVVLNHRSWFGTISPTGPQDVGEEVEFKFPNGLPE